MQNLAELRKNYTLGGLSEAESGSDPFALFRIWFEQALKAGLNEPNAFTLATCSPEGKPSARTVLLKNLDDRGFTFFTNYDSRKGREIAGNPSVAMVFLWDELERQVRIEGRAERVTPEESDAYYRVRPLGSRLGAWASPQSAVIPNREFLEIQHAELLKKFPDGEPPRPSNWGGYRIVPEVIEFWQGRPSRLHDRIVFRRSAEGWLVLRLAP
jgi:pyridoxamine 5'-phosphate oxidase